MAADVVRFAHRRTSEGVTVEASFTGAWQPRIVLAVVAAVVRPVGDRALLGDGYARNPPAAADLNSAAALGGRGEVRLRPVSVALGVDENR